MKLPSQRVTELRRKITRFSNITGADLEKPRLFHPRGVVIAIFAAIGIVAIQFNGVYQAWPNMLKICHTLFFIPLALQILARAINRYGINDEAINLELQKRLVKFCKNHEMNPIYRIVMMKKLDIYSNFFNLFLFEYLIIVHSPFVGMVASAGITGSFQLIAPIYIPFTDPYKLPGFIINAIVQLIFQEITFIALLALDFQLIFYSFQISIMFDILALNLADFGHTLACQQLNPQKSFKCLVRKQIRKNKDVYNENVSQKFIQLIKEYYEITNFTSLLFTELKIPIFTTITSGGLALCLSTLSMLSYSKVIGALAFFFYLTQIAISCILVTFVIHQYEKFLDRLYGFPWYLLSKSDQKVYLQFLQSCQNFEAFELTMIGKIDMELFTTVVNTGYSYLMFIWNFVEIDNVFF